MTIHTYAQARSYLESFIRPSVFERIAEDSHMQDPLDRMRVLLSLLDNPQKKFKSVQVSGTSGKGSTSYLLGNILINAGYKTGLATSPHLDRINQRMLINDREIPNTILLDLVNRLSLAVEQIKQLPEGAPSYFELLTALAFLYFAQEKVEIAVIEVGLEGQYDATNVLDPLIVILTNISKDHVELLGDTEEAIATEAMSIVRKGTSISPLVITGITQNNILDELKKRTRGLGLTLGVLNQTIKISRVSTSEKGVGFCYMDSFGSLGKLYVSLRGEYQALNAALAVAASRGLEHKGFVISGHSIRKGLAEAFFAGRFEVLQKNGKTIILDSAHNEAKITAFLHALDQYYPDESKVFIVGFKKNKDSSPMTKQLFLRNGSFIFTQFHKGADYARSVSMTIAELRENAEIADNVQFSRTVTIALRKAMGLKANIIIVTGSLYLVGEVRSILMPRG